MLLVNGDLWDYAEEHNAWVGITTNGTLKKNGDNVLGSGCAGQFREKYPEAESEVGALVAAEGNHVYLISRWNIFTFPTKHDWFDTESDMDLLVRSAHELADTIARRMLPWTDGSEVVVPAEETWVLPRPGVGAGRLNWNDVKEKIEPILPDNVHIITW